MSKKPSKKPATALVAEAIAAAVPAIVAEQPAAVEAAPAVLTKRTRIPVSGMLVFTDKPAKDRTPHTKWTWEVFQATLPATLAEVVKALETAPVDNEAIRAKCGNLNSHVSYYIRRGLLAVQPAKAAE